MGRKRKLRKKLRKRGIEEQPALVICVGKRCCSPEKSRALVERARAYAEGAHLHVPVVTVGCLDVCKAGPIAATYPKIKVKRHVKFKRARKLLEKLERRTS
jgi:(2Fe-2S) ferredoxin